MHCMAWHDMYLGSTKHRTCSGSMMHMWHGGDCGVSGWQDIIRECFMVPFLPCLSSLLNPNPKFKTGIGNV